MASDKDQLLAMGFEEARIDWALRATSRSGLQAAMDHLLANSDNPVPAAGEADSSASGAAGKDDEDEDEALRMHIKKTGASDEPVVNSIKCSECGKLFRSQATASLHAERSGHEQFEESTDEIKPLTEEEKKDKLNELRKKLAEKRAGQAKEDAAANKANEALRRKAGQDAGQIKEDMQAKEIQRDLERKKREKLEDARAKAAIKAQIEADKKERAAKAAAEKAARAGAGASASGSGTATPPVPAQIAKPSAAVSSSDNPQTRLQVRLHVGGAPLVKAFSSDSTLIDVAEWVASERLEYNVDTVTFASTFPRKTFSRDEMKKTLKENGLTPSAVLMAS